MPSLFRFLVIVGAIGSMIYGGLYILSTRYEPEQQEEKKVVPGVKIIRDK
jgi:hypothetical protein